jgi:hypothetical protein
MAGQRFRSACSLPRGERAAALTVALGPVYDDPLGLVPADRSGRTRTPEPAAEGNIA